MQNDEKISEAVITLLESSIGFGIDCFGNSLRLYQLEDLTFAVCRYEFNTETRKFVFIFEKIFTDAKEASHFFLQMRNQYQLGYDFEKEEK